jgi:Ca2+/Na+ antiporter
MVIRDIMVLLVTMFIMFLMFIMALMVIMVVMIIYLLKFIILVIVVLETYKMVSENLSKVVGEWMGGWNHVLEEEGVKLISRIAFSNQRGIQVTKRYLDHTNHICQKNSVKKKSYYIENVI